MINLRILKQVERPGFFRWVPKCNHTSSYKNQAEGDTHRREAEMEVVQPQVKGERWKMGQ